jgi:hypothetical protein
MILRCAGFLGFTNRRWGSPQFPTHQATIPERNNRFLSLSHAPLTEKKSVWSDACSGFAFGDPRGTGGLPIVCPFVSKPLCTVLLKQMSDLIDVSREQLPAKPDACPPVAVPRHNTTHDLKWVSDGAHRGVPRTIRRSLHLFCYQKELEGNTEQSRV